MYTNNYKVCLDDSIQSIHKEFRDHARALLVSLGVDPSPSNVSKLRGVKIPAGVKISVEAKDYFVYENSQFVQKLEQWILTYPLSLPAKYLALFISGSVDASFDFSHSVQLAENFKQNPTDNSLWTLRAFINNDKFLNNHLYEILVSEFGGCDLGTSALAEMFDFKSSKQVTYREKSYWVFEVPNGIELNLVGQNLANTIEPNSKPCGSITPIENLEVC